ncbi:MAG: hypothetical protein JXR68_08625 [Bacteroidales bacterium]|nr:hypothetical protein [Bacteroidales bacterium]
MLFFTIKSAKILFTSPVGFYQKLSFEKDPIDFNFVLKNYSNKEALKIFFSTYKKLAENGGVCPFRMFKNTLDGYLKFKTYDNIIFLNRANIYKAMLMPLGILAFSSGFFFWNKQFRKNWRKTMYLFAKTFLLKFLICLILSPFSFIILLLIYGFGNLFYYLNSNGDQPNKIRKEYIVNT